MKNLPLILEAERRGVIRPDDSAFLAEGRRRNLPEFGSVVAEKPKQSIAEWEAENSPRSRMGFGNVPGMYMETQPQTQQTDVPKSAYRNVEEAVEGTPLEGVTKAIGLGEVGLEMGTGFAGAVPATFAGIGAVAAEDGGMFKWKNWEKYAPMFHKVAEQLTYSPTTKAGEDASRGMAEWIVKNIDEKLIDKWLVEPNMKEGQENPLAALLGKTSGELFKLVAPIRALQGRAKSPKLNEEFPNENPLTDSIKKFVDEKEVPRQDMIDPNAIAPEVRAIQEKTLRPEPPTMEQKFADQEESTKTDPIPEGYEVRNKLIRKKEPVAEEPLVADDIPIDAPPEAPKPKEQLFKPDSEAQVKHEKLIEFTEKWKDPNEFAKLSRKDMEVEAALYGIKLTKSGAKTAVARKVWDQIDKNRKKSIAKDHPAPTEAMESLVPRAHFDSFLEGSKDITQTKVDSKGHPWMELQEPLNNKGEKQLRIYEKMRQEPDMKKVYENRKHLKERVEEGEWGIPEDVRKGVNEILDKKEQYFRDRFKTEFKKKPVEKFDNEILNEQESLGFIVARMGQLNAKSYFDYGGARGADGFEVKKSIDYDPATGKFKNKTGKKLSEEMKTRRVPGTAERVRPLSQEGGLDLAQVHQTMIHEGHIPKDMDLSTFYDLLQRDLNGDRQYSVKAQDRVNSRGYEDFDSNYMEYVESQTPPKQGPTRPGETLSTFPDFNKIGELSKDLKSAYEKAKNSLFEKPDSRIRVEPEGTQTLSGKQVSFNALRGVMSPNRVAQVFKEFKPYFDIAKKAEAMQHKFSQMTHKRMEAINKDIGDNPIHKKEYSEVLVMGDMMGKQFSVAELTEMQIAPNVQQAYFKTRSYFDHVLTMLNKHLKDSGKDQIKREVGYVPHFFHDWFIKVDGEMLPTSKTWSDAVSRSNKILEDNPNAKVRIYPKNGGQFEKLDMFGGDKYKTTLADMEYLVTQDNMIGKFEMDPLQASELMDGLFDIPGRKRFLGNLLDRRGVKGWDKDVSFMVQHYGNITGRFIALDRMKKKVAEQAGGEGWRLDQEQSGIRGYIKDYVDDINGNPTMVEEMLSKLPIFQKKGMIGRHLKGDRPIAKIASGATSTMAVTKLGLYNVSAAVVNASQIMNTNALLGLEFTKIGLEKAKLFDKGKMSTRDKGIVKKLMIEEQLGLEHDVLMGDAHSMGKIFNKSTRLFQAVEQFNRRTVGLGAYYKFISENPVQTFGLLESGPKNNRALQHQAALDYASKMIDKSQFDYGLFDTPGFIRRSGPIGSIAFQFKKFPIKQTEFMLNLKGAEAKRFWASYGIVVGMVGLPGANFVFDMIKNTFGYDPKLEAQQHLAEWSNDTDSPTVKSLREHASNILLYGLPSELGVNISGRIGISDIIPQSMSDLTGPFPNTVVRAISDMAKEEQDGKWAKVLKDIATGPGNVAVAMQGKTYGRRGRKITDLNPQERLMKSFGFRTMKETREVDKQNMIRYSEKKSRALRAKYVDRAINAIENDRKEELGDIGRDYAEDNLGTSKSFVRAIKREMQQKRMNASQRQFMNQSKLGKYKNLPTYNLGR
jgi:hypothetical protein